MVSTELTTFFDNTLGLEHYDQIYFTPDKFKNWQNDESLVNPYAKWIRSESNCPSLKLDLKVPQKEMAEEAIALLPEFVKHRGDLHPGWHSLTLHGVDKHITEDWNAELYNGRWKEPPKYSWTEIAERCPVTVDWLKNVWLFQSFHRVRFMLLEPGGYIYPHTDYEERRLAAYNLAITNPSGVEFGMEDAGLIPWTAGEVRAIDIGRKHAVRHLGSEPRIHMIIHGDGSDEHNKLLCRSYDLLIKEIKI